MLGHASLVTCLSRLYYLEGIRLRPFHLCKKPHLLYSPPTRRDQSKCVDEPGAEILRELTLPVYFQTQVFSLFMLC